MNSSALESRDLGLEITTLVRARIFLNIRERGVIAQTAVRFDRGPQSTLVHMQPYRETDTTYSI